MSQFKPNKRGLVGVILDKNYGNNTAGERAGFLPEIAKALVKAGGAHLPGQKPKAAKGKDDTDAAMTSRRFTPQSPTERDAHPSNQGGGGGEQSPGDNDLAAVRNEYREKVGKQPYHGWDVETLREKIAEAAQSNA